ncbi:hypothetical protein [Sutterella wadsworthensis]|uniref:hypothetical protein n=1 Tax=Sutterella wadsworthensis TaxID=40545 RepID=UPI0039671274
MYMHNEEPASCFSQQVIQDPDENAQTRSVEFVIPDDAVRLTKDGRLDEVYLRNVICRMGMHDGCRLRRPKWFRELVKKALSLSVTNRSIHNATGASLTYIQEIAAELNARNKNKEIHEEIRCKAGAVLMKYRSGRYTNDFRCLAEECVQKYGHLSVAELANALGTTTLYLQKVKREMPKPQRDSPKKVDEDEKEITPERRLLDRAASTKVDFLEGRYEITCFDGRGSRVGRMLVKLYDTSCSHSSYVIVIDQHGRSTSYINDVERFEFLQKLTGQKL